MSKKHDRKVLSDAVSQTAHKNNGTKNLLNAENG